MRRLQNTFKGVLYRILATLTFFTRLPLWRLCNIPAEHYKHVVPLWPLVGWVTGTVMGVVFLAAQCFLPPLAAALLALGSRLLLTGALHEDGFADFCDGFGGGTTRERILAIMKDSHIGTYGVLGLIFYILTMASLLTHIPQSPLHSPHFTLMLIVSIDTMCKFFASHIIYNLPYARTAEQAKNKLVYASVSFSERLVSILLTLLPISLLFILAPCTISIPTMLKCTALMLLAASIASRLTFRFIGKRIQGYTGDCCGATFIICELASYVVLTALL